MDLNDFADRMRSAVRTGQLAEAMAQTAAQLAVKMDKQAKKHLTGGRPLHVRSGRLRQSVRFGIRPGRGRVDAFVKAGSSRVPYARSHETGEPAIIKPKGKYLRIPLPPALTAAGVDRNRRSIKGMDEFAFVPGKTDDKAYIVNRFSGDMWYVLVKSVRNKKRPFLAPARQHALKQAPYLFRHHMSQALRSVIDGA